MSRSGYSEDYDDSWTLIKYRGQVASAIKGKRGQAFLRDLIAALDALPEKRLIAHELKKDNEVCAIGSVGICRGVNLESLDPENYDAIAETFGIAHQLVQEIEWLNDEGAGYWLNETPEQRWQRMRDWAHRQIVGLT